MLCLLTSIRPFLEENNMNIVRVLFNKKNSEIYTYGCISKSDIESLGERFNGEPFYIYLQIEGGKRINKGFIFKKFTDIFNEIPQENNISELKAKLKSELKDYDYDFDGEIVELKSNNYTKRYDSNTMLEGHLEKYLVLKFKNGLPEYNKKMLLLSKNTYKDFYKKNKNPIDIILANLEINKIHDVTIEDSYYISDIIKTFASTYEKRNLVNSSNYKIKITKSSIIYGERERYWYSKTLSYSNIGMIDLTSSKSICELGLIIAKEFEKGRVYIKSGNSYFHNSNPAILTFECEYYTHFNLGEFTIIIKPKLTDNSIVLNAWN